jgi:hypothetical protein
MACSDGLSSHTIPPGLIRRRSANLQSAINLHTSVLGTGIDTLGVDPFGLEFTDSKGIIGDPDNGLGLPHRRVIKGSLVESRSVSVRGTGMVDFFRRRHLVVVELAHSRVGFGFRAGESSLVGESTGTTTSDSVGRVGVDEVILLESEPINVDLESGSSDNLGDHDGSTSETRGSSLSILIGREEEKTSEADFLQVQTDKDGPECLDVESTASLEVIGLIGTPVKNVLVRGKEEEEGEPCENGDDGLDDRVDNGDTEDQTCWRPDGSPCESVHLVLVVSSETT